MYVHREVSLLVGPHAVVRALIFIKESSVFSNMQAFSIAVNNCTVMLCSTQYPFLLVGYTSCLTLFVDVLPSVPRRIKKNETEQLAGKVHELQ